MSLLVENAEVPVTLDHQRRELRGGAIFIRNNFIQYVGIAADMAAWMAADPVTRAPTRRIDMRGCVTRPREQPSPSLSGNDGSQSGRLMVQARSHPLQYSSSRRKLGSGNFRTAQKRLRP